MKHAASVERRARLLQKVVDYMVKHGLVDLSLRPLAAALRTSPHMLLYFFGSKEQLIAEAMAESRRRQQQTFAGLMARASSPREQLTLAWKFSSSAYTMKYLSFVFEVYALALRQPRRFPNLLERMMKDWLSLSERGLVAAGVDKKRALALATLMSATVRGLQLDVRATGERKRVESALDEFLRLLELRPKAEAEGRRRPSAKGPDLAHKVHRSLTPDLREWQS